MIKSTLSLVFVILLGSISFAHAGYESNAQQLRQIESLQLRADRLTFGKIGPNNYHLAKAHIWLDLARSEYYELESDGIVYAATTQAEALLDALEKKQPNITMNTPVQISGSEPVRPDLWDKITTLKKHVKFPCGQRSVAEAEVHLIWAGHIKLESNWGHAEAYADSAEALLKDAQSSINKCVAKMPVIENVTVSSDVFFAAGDATLEPSAPARINQLIDSIKLDTMLKDVMLIGHADRLGDDKYPELNQLISLQRAESTQQILLDKGIPKDKIRVKGLGSTQPLVKCSTKLSRAEQIACLQPNRRGQIILRGVKFAGTPKEPVK